MNFRQKVCKLFKVYNTCSLPFEYSCLRLRTYQQIRAERQSSHIPQSHFQMAGRKTRAPQSGQTAHTFTGPFVQPVMGPSHLRTGQGGCLINSLGMTFWWEQVMYYWKKIENFTFFVLLHLLLWSLLSGDSDSIQTATMIVFPRIHLILCFVTFLVFLIQSDNFNIRDFFSWCQGNNGIFLDVCVC